jgi:hypothetical protein
MNIRQLKLAGCVVAMCAVWGSAHAQMQDRQMQDRGIRGGTGEAAAMLPERTANGVSYITGGVGDVEQYRFKSMAQQGGYNMMLVFTFNTGEYLADVEVNVRNQRGAGFDVVTDGPFLAAKVPPGNYTVTARYKGNVDRKQVNVGSSGLRTAFMRFPVGPDAGIVASGSERYGTEQPPMGAGQPMMLESAGQSGARTYVR